MNTMSQKRGFFPIAMLAAAMMGGMESASSIGSKMLEFKPPTDWGDMFGILRSSRRPKGRVAQNQKQRRKDRRRAWAAGDRKAFNK